MPAELPYKGPLESGDGYLRSCGCGFHLVPPHQHLPLTIPDAGPELHIKITETHCHSSYTTKTATPSALMHAVMISLKCSGLAPKLTTYAKGQEG